jgi:hypothetical protein
MLQAAVLHSLLRTLQRSDTFGHPEVAIACYLATSPLPELDFTCTVLRLVQCRCHQEEDIDFSGHTIHFSVSRLIYSLTDYQTSPARHSADKGKFRLSSGVFGKRKIITFSSGVGNKPSSVRINKGPRQ